MVLIKMLTEIEKNSFKGALLVPTNLRENTQKVVHRTHRFVFE